MITPRIKPSSFFPDEAADDLFVAQQRKAKLEVPYGVTRYAINTAGA